MNIFKKLEISNNLYLSPKVKDEIKSKLKK